MRGWWLAVSLGMLLFCHGCLANSRSVEEVVALVKKQLASTADILSVTNGQSLAEVKAILGSAARHEFTVSATGSEYLLIGCFADIGSGVNVLFLFRDGILTKIPEWVPFDMVEVPYRGTTCRMIKPWDVGDMTRIDKTIAARAKTSEQLRDYFNSFQPDRRTSGEPANIMPAFLLTGYFQKMAPRMRLDYETNEQLRKQYDGCRVSLGMDIEQVDGLFGKPLRSFQAKNGCLAKIYGDTRHLEIDSQYRFSCVAVVFDDAGRVAAVLSHYFFDKTWLDEQ